MRYVLKNIDEITDSREILESRPHPFVQILIYIIIAILIAAFLWSWFSEKEIVVKATGVVEPNKSTTIVASESAGKVTAVNIKDGDKVKAGQVLYTIDHSSLDAQKTAYEADLKLMTTEVNNLNKLKQSITDGKNYFNQNSSDEKDYYDKYERYVEGTSDINNSAKSAQVQIQDLQDQVNKLTLLQKSINDNKNYFNDGSSYDNQYKDYATNLQQFQLKINDAQNQYNGLKNELNSNRSVTQSQVDSAKLAIDSANEDLQKYKAEFMENISSTLEQDQNKVRELQSTPSLSQESGSQYTSIDEYKNDNLSQINSNIISDQSKINQDNGNIQTTNISIDQCSVKAGADGIINELNIVNVGDVLQAGTQLVAILPSSNSKYKMDIYIANKDSGNIKKGQTIRCNFDALPYSKYGSIDTTISSLSADAKVDSNSKTSYYSAEAEISNKPLYDKKGEQAYVKAGMTCEIDIVTKRENMLYWLLEQINLKD
jgi:multidrug resistance efflux pump